MHKPNFPPIKIFLKRAIITIFVVIIIVGLGFWGYTEFVSYNPETQALNTALSDNKVVIQEKSSYFIITPNTLKTDSNPIIFYPGGLVKPLSYLAKMVKISEQTQTKIFLIKSPFNVALFDIGVASRIISENSLNKPILAGHSLGGVAGCRYVKDNPEKISGLYLYGSYCDQNISDFKGSVLSVIGQNDQILNYENYVKAKSNLPTQAILREVQDLNHSNIGNYGLQKGDGKSGLSIDEVVKVMIE